MRLTTEEIQLVTQSKGSILNPSHVWTRVSTDSRALTPGALFVALAGDNFDAHDFIAQALDQGCQGILVHKDVSAELSSEQKKKIQVFEVQDTLNALQKIAHLQSQKLESCLKIAITGTSGKTSTKYFAHQLLEGQVPHYFSPKSFNNHIGVPLSLLEIDHNDKAALLEVGMNHHGEIKNLISIINPEVTLVTMVGRGHLEGLGTVDDVLKEKMSMYTQGQTHIINKDDAKILQYYKAHFQAASRKRVYVSSSDMQADICLQAVEDMNDPFGSFQVHGHILGVEGKARIAVPGLHHVINVLMAVAIATQAGMQPQQVWMRLDQLRSFWGRSEVLRSSEGLQFYFDAYNANPESMKAFLDQVRKLKNPAHIILGEMLELGSSSPELHYELGVLAAQTPHAQLWFMGPSGAHFLRGYESQEKHKKPVITDTYKEDVALKYKSMLNTGDWIALKGSRGMRLETFLSLFEGVKLH